MEMGTAAMENNKVVPQNIKDRITICPAIPLLGRYPKEWKARTQRRYLYTQVYGSICSQ